MPKVNLKKGRPKSYAEKLRERQERMNLIDRPEVVFMPGEELSDNEADDVPLEIVTKREVLPLLEEETPLSEIKIQPKKPAKKKKPTIKKVGENKFAVKVDNSVKFEIKAPVKKERPTRNKLSFREHLLLISTKDKRSEKHGNKAHINKWSNRRVAGI